MQAESGSGWDKVCAGHAVDRREDGFGTSNDEESFAGYKLGIEDYCPAIDTFCAEYGSRASGMRDYPMLLLNSDIHTVEHNQRARVLFGQPAGTSIDLLPLDFTVRPAADFSTGYKSAAASNISAFVGKLLLSPAMHGKTVLRRVRISGSDREGTLAVSILHHPQSRALLTVLVSHCSAGSLQMLQSQFTLTDAEAAVLAMFVEGFSAPEIAKRRKRSHATVKTQLQSIMSKAGARNQLELLRLSMSLTAFGRDCGVTDKVEAL